MPTHIPLPPNVTEPIDLADWLELQALSTDDGNASHGDLQCALKTLGIDDLAETCAGSMRELNRRVAATGASYPFTFSGTLLKVKSDWHHFTPYIFCLLLSYSDDARKKVSGIRHEVLFEHLSCLAATGYINGEGVRFGWPRDTLPSAFKAALTKICQEVGEWSCPRSIKTLRTKDGGLDLVAWRHFADRQIGKLILFGHCASGSNWEDKIHELQPSVFCSQWLGGDRSPVVKSFFIPHRLDPALFENRAISAKLFFDRCRIAFWAPNGDFGRVTSNANVRWCEAVLRRVRA